MNPSSINKIINPKFWTLARESRGMTQKDLAMALDINQGWLSRAESGLREISPLLLEKAAKILNYPIDFFYQEDPLYGLGTTNLFNRKRQSVPVKTIHRIQAQLNIKRLQVQRLLQSVDIPPCNIPQYDIDEFNDSPIDVANTLRAYWKVPSGPIDSLVDLIENNGGIVIEFDFQTSKIDAMSIAFPDIPPLFFINPQVPKSRLRFTLCHELGHILMHQNALTPEIEQQADQFASEFLLPSREIKPYFLDSISISKLIDLKMYWKVSMQAILVKAKNLDTITPSNYSSLWIALGRCGYRKNEPAEDCMPQESPTLLTEIVDLYKNNFHYTSSELGQLLYINESEVNELYYRNSYKLRLIK